MERIEIFTGEQRRRRYTPQERAKFVAMTMQPGFSVSLVARQNGITPSLVFKWKKLMQDGGMSAIQAGDEVVSAAEHKALQATANCTIRLGRPRSLMGHLALEVIANSTISLGRFPEPKRIFSIAGHCKLHG